MSEVRICVVCGRPEDDHSVRHPFQAAWAASPKTPPFPPYAAEPLLQFFEYAHLREDLKPVSARFSALAMWIVEDLPPNPERKTALRKLLEAKDCAVRAKLWKWP